MQPKLFFLVILVVYFTSTAVAQNFQVLGLDPSSNQQYECVRFGSPKLNTILITDLDSGKETNLKTKKAKKRLARQIRKSVRRRKKLNKLLRRAQKKLKRETKRIPSNQGKIDKFKSQISRLDVRISQQESTTNILKSLRGSLDGCNKDLPLSGNIEVISNIAVPPNQTKPVFGAIAVLRLSDMPESETVCAQISGNSAWLNGASGSLDFEAPAVSVKSVALDPCLLRFNGECLKRESGVFAYFQSYGGTEDPGTCTIPARCSVNAAVAALNGLVAGMTVNVIGDGSKCNS